MGASVTFVDESFADDLIEDLAERLGVNRYEVRGRLLFVWRQATSLGVTRLPPHLIAKHLDPEKLVASGMGEIAPDGSGEIELRGGWRLLWLSNKVEAGRKHGKKGARFGRLGGRPRKTPSKPGEGVLKNPPSASASASASASDPLPSGEGERPSASPPSRGKAGRKTSLPPGWTPELSHTHLARELGVDLQREATKFRDYALANGKVYARWDAAFANWLRNAQRFNGHPRSGNGASPATGDTEDPVIA